MIGDCKLWEGVVVTACGSDAHVCSKWCGCQAVQCSNRWDALGIVQRAKQRKECRLHAWI